ncbi:MAG TPA: hypothetical protein ENJ38_01865 [Rhodospirillales bacterium]|nr:hypothetical protein [Rhodospirillales bacterium]
MRPSGSRCHQRAGCPALPCSRHTVSDATMVPDMRAFPGGDLGTPPARFNGRSHPRPGEERRRRGATVPSIVPPDGAPRLPVGSTRAGRLVARSAGAILPILDRSADPKAAVALSRSVARNGLSERERATATGAPAGALVACGHELVVRLLERGPRATPIEEGGLPGAADPRREGAPGECAARASFGRGGAERRFRSARYFVLPPDRGGTRPDLQPHRRGSSPASPLGSDESPAPFTESSLSRGILVDGGESAGARFTRPPLSHHPQDGAE